MELTAAVREKQALQQQLKTHLQTTELETKRLREEIRKREEVLKLSASGIDLDKVTLARTVLYAWDYAKGGDERGGCVADAIRDLANGCQKLRSSYMGTKSYAHWHGQRSDHPYMYGPKHGSMIFEIGLVKEARQRDPFELTAEETEAAIYFLTNIERIQKAERAAKSEAAA